MFSESWVFSHVTRSPLYPRSNGLAERNVGTVKALLTKALENREDWQLVLLNFRNSALTGEQYSPAQLLTGVHVLRPAAVNAAAVRAHRETINRPKRITTEVLGHCQRTLQPDKSVRIRNNKQWSKSKVVKLAQDKRSNWLRTENGLFRRNRQHLMKIPKCDDCKYYLYYR